MGYFKTVQDEGVVTAIKGSSNVSVTSSGGNTVIASNPKANSVIPADEGENYTGFENLIVDDNYLNGEYYDAQSQTTHKQAVIPYKFGGNDHKYAWSRAAYKTAPRGFVLKVLTRTYYDKDYDKNFNFYFLVYFGNSGKVLKVEGEFREEAFETTLHEHPM